MQPEEPIPIGLQEYPDWQAARAAMVDWDYCRSRNQQEKQWQALRIGAHPIVVRHAMLMVKRFAQWGIPLFVSEFVRSAERQRQLKADGFSKADPEKGPHVWGCAYDLVHSTKGWSLTPMQWQLIGAVGKELAVQRTLPMTWGGDWPPIKQGVGWDAAHWQLKAWRNEMSGFPFLPGL